MKLKRIALTLVVLSSICLSGCKSDNAGEVVTPITETTVPAAETISSDILLDIENKTVDIKGYYITTDIRGDGKAEKEREKDYKGLYLKDIEVLEQADDTMRIKAYLTDNEDFFITAEKAELEYNVKDKSIQVVSDNLRMEPTNFFDIDMFYDERYKLKKRRGTEKLPDFNKDSIKEIVLLDSLEGELIIKNDFYYNGYVKITDKNDNVFRCTVHLFYKPNEKDLYRSFSREKAEKSPVWDIEIISVKELDD